MGTKILVNKYEEITHDRLLVTCVADGARVCPKVRVKDVLPVDGSGIAPEQFSYALRSHFDFVVADREWRPLFAVEFDGSSHETPDGERKDMLKNGLCARFQLPLLRIRATHLQRRFRQWDLLSYFVETWFLRRAFYDAQEKGLVPPEEDFDPLMVISDGKGTSWPYWFAAPSQLAIHQLHKEGRVAHTVPSHFTAYDPAGNCHCLAFLKISTEQWASTKTAMRAQSFDIDMGELTWQIAIVELREKLDQVLAGRLPPLSDVEIEESVRQFRARFGRFCSFGGIVEPPLLPHATAL
jgi:hypothetical protein